MFNKTINMATTLYSLAESCLFFLKLEPSGAHSQGHVGCNQVWCPEAKAQNCMSSRDKLMAGLNTHLSVESLPLQLHPRQNLNCHYLVFGLLTQYCSSLMLNSLYFLMRHPKYANIRYVMSVNSRHQLAKSTLF